ncbi:MAG: hypothetical protein AMXMBFR50_25630 [Ignavibacterium album]
MHDLRSLESAEAPPLYKTKIDNYMFNSRNLKLFISFLFIGYSSTILSQIKQEHRHPEQFYIEDSAKVYWTAYPNPFCPPTITEKTKGLFCGFDTFYCELSDSVLVAIKNEKDSIVYSEYIFSKRPPYFSYCVWVAGSEIDKNELPDSYYHFEEKQNIKIVLIVDGKEKCYRKGVISDKRYYWFKSD